MLKELQLLSYSYPSCIADKQKVTEIKNYETEKSSDGPLINTSPFICQLWFTPYIKDEEHTNVDIILLFWPREYSKGLFEIKMHEI